MAGSIPVPGQIHEKGDNRSDWHDEPPPLAVGNIENHPTGNRWLRG
jgi:hypothetical protein